jgi:hypothetical protein
MNKAEIQKHLRDSHAQFIRRMAAMSNKDFLKSNNGKWTAAQQLEHIVKSVQPVKLALTLPGFFLKMTFGKANRPSRTYDALVEKYQSKLAEGGVSPGRFIPTAVELEDRNRLLNKLQSLVDSLIRLVNDFSEEQLDLLILPHPLLGKLTLREMLCFTIYHVRHHDKQVIQNIAVQRQTA